MEQIQQASKCAAIDMGSNSVDMIIANCFPDRLDIIKEDARMLRLGESVKETGGVDQERREALLAALREYREQAESEQTSSVLAVGTEALREAQNNQEIVDEIERSTSIQPHIISGIVEAALTYHGAIYGANVSPDAGVLDLGGNSTELVTARQRHITWLSSLPLGSGWLHDHFLNSDPPIEDDVQDAQNFLQQYVQQLHIPSFPLHLVVTGSSAKYLLKIARQILKKDEQDHHLTSKDLASTLGILHNLHSEEVAQRYGVEQERAKVLFSGALFLQTMMQYLRLNEVYISDTGLREGVLLAYARYGEEWLANPEVKPDDTLIGKAPPIPEKFSRNERQHETFKESARNELLKRGKAFLDGTDAVVENEDVEAVHKMRVASRRLRASMDAYQSACKPKLFQKTYQQVKQTADFLGAARDTDVMMQHVREQMEQSEDKAGTQWLLDRLTACRKKQQQKLETFLINSDEQRFQQQLAASITK